MNDERQVVAASLIVQFYQDVSQLSHHFCIYRNYLVELGVKGKENQDMNDNESQALQVTVQNYRYFANKTYIQFLTLSKEGVIDNKEQVKQHYAHINNPKNFIIEVQQAENYLTEIMALFLKGIVKDLLNTSQQIFNEIYGNKQSTTEQKEN